MDKPVGRFGFGACLRAGAPKPALTGAKAVRMTL
jgi:hypothetical protein|tara:strand:+ start:243 stop:344 length:102 start_codon:yes stop_codon:yes gene_type:complete